MKKYSLIFSLAFVCCAAASAADFGDLLDRLNSRDFSAERKTLTGEGGVYVGETLNPHSETVMFKARDEFREKMAAAREDAALQADLNAFILEAMSKDVSLETKVWLLDQIAVLGTSAEVPALTELMTGSEQRLVDASAAALAKIPGDEALAALKANAESIPAAASALVSRTAPVLPPDSVEGQFPLGLGKATDEQVKQWLEGYDAFDTELKVKTLASLTDRDSKEYRPYAIEALASDDPLLKRAGFLALEKMATAEDVDYFVSALADESYRGLSIRLAGFVVAPGFDEALLERLDTVTDNAAYHDLITILVSRSVDVREAVFKRAASENCEDRLSFLSQIAPILTAADVQPMVKVALLIPRGADRDAAENLIAGVLHQDAAPLIALLGNDYPPSALYPIICRTGGDAAKALIEESMKSSDKDKRDAAFRALPNCADAQFAYLMMQYLESGKLSAAQQQAFLRAYIRVISLPEDKDGIEMDRDQKLEQLKKAYAMATRPDEKKLILGRLAANRTDKSLAFAVECVADPDVVEEACQAIADHAHDTALRKQFPDQMMEAIDLVLATSKNQELIERVKIYKGRME